VGPTFGYLLPTRDAVAAGRFDAAPLIELGQLAEQAGFDGVWVGDSPLARPRHEPFTLLSAVAARTSRVTLGTAVLLAPLRHPLALAHEAATLDRISDGRLLLGVGAGFPLPQTEAQFDAFQIPYRTRISRLEEIVAILRLAWRHPGEAVSFAGRHFEFADVHLEPRPAQEGGPPIWLAGAGDRACARVGRLADGWLPYSPSPEQYRQDLAHVERAARDHGRPIPRRALYVTAAIETAGRPDAAQQLRRSVEKYYNFPLEAVASVQGMFAGPAEKLAQALAPYLEAGVEYVLLRLAGDDPQRALESAATELLPRLRAASPRRAA
jgi:probable F420-dependent oxidoreductase